MFTVAREKKTGNGQAAGCWLFYRKIYGYFCSVYMYIGCGMKRDVLSCANSED